MRRRFRSISYKLSIGLAVSTIIPLMAFCFFFYSFMRDSYRDNYIRQSETNMEVSVWNINHYISTCITSAQSVYYNSDVQDLLVYGDPRDFNTIESVSSKQILSYMLSVYAATPDAVQIRLSAYRLGRSFLVNTRNLQKYIKPVDYSVPSEDHYQPEGRLSQLSVESVHPQHSYGHTIRYDALGGQVAVGPQVFTIHLPIYYLPNLSNVVGTLSIDIPISFIESNCGGVFHEEEANFVVDGGGNIIFASDPDLIGQTVWETGLEDLLAERNVPKSSLRGETITLARGFDSGFMDWYLVKTVPTRVVYEDVHLQMVMLLLSFAVCLILAVLLNSLSVLRYTIPLNKATAYMHMVNDRVEDAMDTKIIDYVGYGREDEISVLLTGIENMLNSLGEFTIRQYKLDIANRTAELKMLQAQINPHFIYNTLQCLATKSLQNNDRELYDYITSLGQMMQYSMETSHPLVPLQDEIQHVARYLQLQAMRFGNELTVNWQVDSDTEKIIVPKMILQPLIENSLKHGDLFASGRGWIGVRAAREDGRLVVKVRDNGHPLTPEKRGELRHKFQTLWDRYIDLDYQNYQRHVGILEVPRQGTVDLAEAGQMFSQNHIGLVNVYLRLLLNFGSGCGIDIYPNDQGGTTVRLDIAYQSLWEPGGQVRERGGVAHADTHRG